MTIRSYNKEELVGIRSAAKLAAELLKHLSNFVVAGVSTQELNDEAERWTKAHGATSAPLGYGKPPYPASICTSINEMVCHGYPCSRILKEGDIVNVDVSPILNGWFGDTSKTFKIGKVSAEAEKLVNITWECLMLGIGKVKPGGRIGDIGAAIQAHAEKNGLSVVRAFTGHSIGHVFHGDLQVPHFGIAHTGVEMRPGMVFTIEPMINVGTYEVEFLNEWEAVTKDRKLSAQFEHTVLVTETGVEILTKL